MTSLSGLIEFWDTLIRRWVMGDRDVPHALTDWFSSYRGTGRGEVRLDVFPEPYTGRLHGNDSPVVMLGLNPGAAVPHFQSPGGVFFEQLIDMPYSQWASTVPYASAEWESVAGPNRFYRNRFAFARRLLDDDSWRPEGGVFFELYPWHSSAVTAAMTPSAHAIHEYVLEPIGELDTPHVFAFGRPWFDVAASLGLGQARALEVEWGTPSRHARVHRLSSGQELVVMAQNGYAGPPGADDTELLASALGYRAET